MVIILMFSCSFFCRRFHIINPTSSGYDFLWSDEGGLTSGLAEPFTCVTPQGHVAAGKKYEVQEEISVFLRVQSCCFVKQ